MHWIDWLLLIAAIALVVEYVRMRLSPSNKVARPKVWHLHIHTIDAKHKITVLEDEYNALKTWLRGEGDSLFEMATDDAYLGLKRAHVVSVKGARK